jgi:predicted ABC-type ATPase
LNAADPRSAAAHLTFADGKLGFPDVEVNSYLASLAVEFIREKLIAHSLTLTLETVMSHPSKIELLKEARELGYRTYLYFVATEDPEINVSRVRYRVQRQGGHSVPKEKIISRYFRSLELLLAAIRQTNRAYLFDNSGENQAQTWVAEITDGRVLELKTDLVQPGSNERYSTKSILG